MGSNSSNYDALRHNLMMRCIIMIKFELVGLKTSGRETEICLFLVRFFLCLEFSAKSFSKQSVVAT